MSPPNEAPRANFDVKAEIAAYWDGRAARFDESPSHLIRPGAERSAWQALFDRHLPPGLARPKVLELGCGTGLITDLLLERGCVVTAVDLAERMLARARTRLAGRDVSFLYGDAEDPFLAGDGYDAIVSRHLVWTLPEPERAFGAWRGLLAPGGRVLVIDGHWRSEALAPRLLRGLADRMDGGPRPPGGDQSIRDPGSPYERLRGILPFGMGGAPAERVSAMLEAAGFARPVIDTLGSLKRRQRRGRPMAFRLRSLATRRYLIRAEAAASAPGEP